MVWGWGEDLQSPWHLQSLCLDQPCPGAGSRREGDSGRAWEAPPSLWGLAVKQWGFAKSSLGPGLRSHRILGFWGFGWWLQGPVISSGLRARIPE